MRLLFLVEGHSHGTQPLKRTVTSKLSYEWIFTVVCYLCFNENVPIAVPVLPFPNTERIKQFFSWLDQLPPTIKKKKILAHHSVIQCIRSPLRRAIHISFCGTTDAPVLNFGDVYPALESLGRSRPCVLARLCAMQGESNILRRKRRLPRGGGETTYSFANISQKRMNSRNILSVGNGLLGFDCLGIWTFLLEYTFSRRAPSVQQ